MWATETNYPLPMNEPTDVSICDDSTLSSVTCSIWSSYRSMHSTPHSLDSVSEITDDQYLNETKLNSRRWAEDYEKSGKVLWRPLSARSLFNEGTMQQVVSSTNNQNSRVDLGLKEQIRQELSHAAFPRTPPPVRGDFTPSIPRRSWHSDCSEKEPSPSMPRRTWHSGRSEKAPSLSIPLTSWNSDRSEKIPSHSPRMPVRSIDSHEDDFEEYDSSSSTEMDLDGDSTIHNSTCTKLSEDGSNYSQSDSTLSDGAQSPASSGTRRRKLKSKKQSKKRVSSLGSKDGDAEDRDEIPPAPSTLKSNQSTNIKLRPLSSAEVAKLRAPRQSKVRRNSRRRSIDRSKRRNSVEDALTSILEVENENENNNSPVPSSGRSCPTVVDSFGVSDSRSSLLGDFQEKEDLRSPGYFSTVCTYV